MAKIKDVAKKAIARSLAPRLNAPSLSRVASPGAAAAPPAAAVATRAPLDDDVVIIADLCATVARVSDGAHAALETTMRFMDKLPFAAHRARLASRAPRVGVAARAAEIDGMIRTAWLMSDAVVARARVTSASGTDGTFSGHFVHYFWPIVIRQSVNESR